MMRYPTAEILFPLPENPWECTDVWLADGGVYYTAYGRRYWTPAQGITEIAFTSEPVQEQPGSDCSISPRPAAS